jgi:type VI secretion system secreted protein VgrG
MPDAPRARRLVPTPPANTPRFSFATPRHDPGLFQVAAFEGTEALSQPFEFRLALVAPQNGPPRGRPGPDEVVGLPATLTIERGHRAEPIAGIVTRLEHRATTPHGAVFEAVLRPRLWRLALSRRSRVFREAGVEGILRDVLAGAGIGASDVDVRLASPPPPRETCIQYRETDLAFLNRLLEHEGVFYFFRHTDEADVLVVADTPEALDAMPAPSALTARSAGGLVRDTAEHVAAFGMREEMTPDRVVLADYSPEAPEVDLCVEARSAPAAPGGEAVEAEHYEFGSGHADVERGRHLARVRAEALACRRRRFVGTSDCPALRPGHRFAIEGHDRTAWNADYLPVRIQHVGSQRRALGLAGIALPDLRLSDVEGTEADAPAGYRNRFECLPADVPYRPPRRTPVPHVPGLLTATVESAGGRYAYIDEAGRYRARLHFDRSEREPGAASAPIRLAQASSGPGYGVHFPNHPGTEMVVACLNGDVDRPVALGTVPNATQRSPTTGSNRTENRIRSFAGHELRMDDTADAGRVLLRSAGGLEVRLDDGGERIEIRTPGGHAVLVDDAAGRLRVRTASGRGVAADDQAEALRLHGAHGAVVEVDDGADRVRIADETGRHALTLDFGGETLALTTETGDLRLEAPEGTIALRARSVQVEASDGAAVEAGADVRIAGRGGVALESGADLTAEAVGRAGLQGRQAAVEGADTLRLEGGREAALAAQRVVLRGAALADIKAALVKINS